MKTWNIIKSIFFISIYVLIAACNDDAAEESISADNYPRIIATSPTLPMKGENGELGKLNVKQGETITIKVIYTPFEYAEAVWYVDGVQEGTGDEFKYSNETPGIYHLKLVVSTTSYETTREVNLNVYSTGTGGEFSGFEIHKGVNIGNWLSQSSARGEERKNKFKETDAIFLSQQGFDHLRLPVDEEQLFTESGEVDEETLNLIYKTADWCQLYNMRLIFDFHILRSHNYEADNKPLWTSKEEQDKFVRMWKTIHDKLQQYPDDMLAYELLNEPVAPSSDIWNTLVNRLITELREVAPARMLIIGSNLWNSVSTISDLQIPSEDKNIMLTFHYYEPYLLTHYHASWTDFANLNLPLNYPGLLVRDEDFNNLPADQQEIVRPYKQEYTRESILNNINVAVTAARAKGVKLYCGEFGCLPYSNLTSRYAWYRDLVSIFNETEISYGAWEYNAIFGFCTPDGGLKDATLVDILLGREGAELTTIYTVEAEDCEKGGGTMIIEDNAAASGGKHVNHFWGDSNLKFDVTVEEAGVYYLKIRYVCGTDVWIYSQVNGGVKQMIPCPNSGGWWSEFTDAKTVVNLSAGKNTISFTPEPTGSPILDKFEVCKIKK